MDVGKAGTNYDKPIEIEVNPFQHLKFEVTGGGSIILYGNVVPGLKRGYLSNHYLPYCEFNSRRDYIFWNKLEEEVDTEFST